MKNKGALAVETLLFLIPFTLAFCTIINFGRFIQAEMVIHHAITQTAKEISAYGYILTKTGITGRIQKTNKTSGETREKIDSVIDSTNEFMEAFSKGDVPKMVNSGKTTYNNTKMIVNDPSSIMSSLISLVKNYAEQKVLTEIAGGLAKGSVQKQVSLTKKDADADEYCAKQE